jgi:benzoyl-CoA reductase subunit B
VRGQIEELIPVCEEITGKKYDQDKLKEILKLSQECIDLWTRLMDNAKNVPSPFDSYFDGVSYMAPMTIWRGTREAIEYYELANEQMAQRLKQNYSPVGQERFRLVFEGSPPWPALSEFKRMFHNWGAVAVASTYLRVVCACEELRRGADDPMELLTDLASQSIYNWTHRNRIKLLENLAGEYSADGIVTHSIRSCRPLSIGQLDIRKYMTTEPGIPTLFLDSDNTDPRFFSSTQIGNRIDTFFSVLEKKKRNNKERKEA